MILMILFLNNCNGTLLCRSSVYHFGYNDPSGELPSGLTNMTNLALLDSRTID
jgi:hypothetical protein